MSKIEGVAKKFDGTAIDYVSVFNWVDGKCIAQVVPNATGAWEWLCFKDDSVGFTYVADGCEPITHGSYSAISDNVLQNGDFRDNFNGWDASGHWRWTSGRAYHPLTTSYNPLTQNFVATGLMRVVVDIELIVGDAQVFFQTPSNNYIHQINNIGLHRFDFTINQNKEVNMVISRSTSTIPTEFFVDSAMVMVEV